MKLKAYVGFVDISTLAGKKNLPLGWKVISWFQRSPMVHCFMAYGDGYGDPIDVYETTETEFIKRTLWERIAGTPCVLFEVTEGDALAMLNHSRTMLGKIYDYSAIFGLGIMLAVDRLTHQIFLWLNKGLAKIDVAPLPTDYEFLFLGNPYHMKAALFCSEAVCDTLRAGGAKIPDWWLNESVTPRQLHRWCAHEGSAGFRLAHVYQKKEA